MLKLIRGAIMIEKSPKQLYAEAVLSGAMTKTAAFKAFINAAHYNPSQGAYRLEHTKMMSRLMKNVKEDLDLSKAIRHKQLRMTERSLDLLDGLLPTKEVLAVKDQLAILRLAKRV